MLVSMVSPSTMPVTLVSRQSGQVMTVCGGPGPIAGSDGVAVELPLEQATANTTAKNVVVKAKRMGQG